MFLIKYFKLFQPSYLIGKTDDTWQEISRTTSSLEGDVIKIDNQGGIQMKHVLADLEPASDYEAIITVQNKFGKSANSEPFIFHTIKGNFTCLFYVEYYVLLSVYSFY